MLAIIKSADDAVQTLSAIYKKCPHNKCVRVVLKLALNHQADVHRLLNQNASEAKLIDKNDLSQKEKHLIEMFVEHMKVVLYMDILAEHLRRNESTIYSQCKNNLEVNLLKCQLHLFNYSPTLLAAEDILGREMCEELEIYSVLAEHLKKQNSKGTDGYVAIAEQALEEIQSELIIDDTADLKTKMVSTALLKKLLSKSQTSSKPQSLDEAKQVDLYKETEMELDKTVKHLVDITLPYLPDDIDGSVIKKNPLPFYNLLVRYSMFLSIVDSDNLDRFSHRDFVDETNDIYREEFDEISSQLK